jgi:hypothetical protein
MNRKQKMCLLVGLALIVLIGFFPPNELRLPELAGPWAWWERWTILMLHRSLYNVPLRYVRFCRLFGQWSIVVLITSGLICACRDKKPKGERK